MGDINKRHIEFLFGVNCGEKKKFGWEKKPVS